MNNSLFIVSWWFDTQSIVHRHSISTPNHSVCMNWTRLRVFLHTHFNVQHKTNRNARKVEHYCRAIFTGFFLKCQFLKRFLVRSLQVAIVVVHKQHYWTKHTIYSNNHYLSPFFFFLKWIPITEIYAFVHILLFIRLLDDSMMAYTIFCYL